MYCHLQSCKKFGRSFQQIKRKYRKARKRTLNPLSSWIFLEKLSSSNNASYCHLQSCHKSRGCCRRFGEMTKKVKKTPFWTLNPLQSGIKNFFRKIIQLKLCALLSSMLKAVFEKIQKHHSDGRNDVRTDGQGSIYRINL